MGRRGHPLVDIVRWMATAPASLAGIRHKGQLTAGADADLCIFAPDDEYVVDPARLSHRHRLTPYEGMRLRGSVRRTFLRGNEITLGDPPGVLLARKP